MIPPDVIRMALIAGAAAMRMHHDGNEFSTTLVDDFYATDFVRGRIPVRSYDTMTEEMYEVYQKHGGHKKHPLDEVQGL